MAWNPKKTYEEATGSSDTTKVLDPVGSAIDDKLLGGKLKKDPWATAREVGTTYMTGGLNQVDKAAGSPVAGMIKGAFSGPDTEEFKDPKGPKDIVAPTMAPGTNAATVKNPLDPKNVTIGPVKDPKAAIIDGSQQGQFRDFQSGLAAQLAQQASGVGPSLAGNTLKQGQQANLAATMAQLNSQRGGANPAMARATMQTAAEIQGKAAQEAADARLKEQMAAQGLLSQVAGAGREQDIGLATSQAQMQQQANLEKYKGDLQLAVQQGQIDQQTAMAMFAEANQNARLDATLAAQFQSLQAQYVAMGMDAQKANQLAALEIEKLKFGITQANNQQKTAENGANKQMMGNILQAGATVAGTIYGGPMGGAAAGAGAGALVNGAGASPGGADTTATAPFVPSIGQ